MNPEERSELEKAVDDEHDEDFALEEAGDLARTPRRCNVGLAARRDSGNVGNIQRCWALREIFV